MCIKETQYQVRVDNTTSSPFTVGTGLKQGDALFLIIFNIALEKVKRELKHVVAGISINYNKIRLFSFTDTLDIIEGTLEDILCSVARLLDNEARKVGLLINTNKTMQMELIHSGKDPVESGGLNFEKVADFKYLGATTTWQ